MSRDLYACLRQYRTLVLWEAYRYTSVTEYKDIVSKY